MSTSPQGAGQRTIVVHLEHEPEVTHEVSFSVLLLINEGHLSQHTSASPRPQGFAIGECPFILIRASYAEI